MTDKATFLPNFTAGSATLDKEKMATNFNGLS